MKNRNIQFKPTAGLLIPLLLACFAAVFISAAAPAVSRGYRAVQRHSLGVTISSVPLDECIPRATDRQRECDAVGPLQRHGGSIFKLCDVTICRQLLSLAANGDSISGPFTGTLTPTSITGVFDNDELAFITGGTGRFANATGLNLGGQIDINTEPLSLPMEGTISTVGSDGTRDWAPDLRIATSVRLVAMRETREESCHSPIGQAKSYRRSRTQDSIVATASFPTDYAET